MRLVAGVVVASSDGSFGLFGSSTASLFMAALAPLVLMPRITILVKAIIGTAFCM